MPPEVWALVIDRLVLSDCASLMRVSYEMSQLVTASLEARRRMAPLDVAALIDLFRCDDVSAVQGMVLSGSLTPCVRMVVSIYKAQVTDRISNVALLGLALFKGALNIARMLVTTRVGAPQPWMRNHLIDMLVQGTRGWCVMNERGPDPRSRYGTLLHLAVASTEPTKGCPIVPPAAAETEDALYETDPAHRIHPLAMFHSAMSTSIFYAPPIRAFDKDACDSVAASLGIQQQQQHMARFVDRAIADAQVCVGERERQAMLALVVHAAQKTCLAEGIGALVKGRFVETPSLPMDAAVDERWGNRKAWDSLAQAALDSRIVQMRNIANVYIASRAATLLMLAMCQGHSP